MRISQKCHQLPLALASCNLHDSPRFTRRYGGAPATVTGPKTMGSGKERTVLQRCDIREQFQWKIWNKQCSGEIQT